MREGLTSDCARFHRGGAGTVRRVRNATPNGAGENKDRVEE